MAVTFALVGLAVKDMAASLRFYRQLGLDIPEGAENEAHVQIQANGVQFAWDTIEVLKQVYGEWKEPVVGHRVELAFQCDHRDEVDATYAKLTAQGYRGQRAPWDAFWGQRYAIVEDPDGNSISLFA